MADSPGKRTPAGVAIGLICGALFIGGAWIAIDGVLDGSWFGALAAVVAMVFFAVGAVGGLLGAERLPDRSIEDLMGWTSVSRALDRPVRDWFTPGRSPR